MKGRWWVGVDGCRGGWFSVGFTGGGPGAPGAPPEGAAEGPGPAHLGPVEGWEAALDPDVASLWARWGARAGLVLVDIPVGLPDEGAERACDGEARRLLGPRRSSVFPAPCRAVLEAMDWAEASRVNRERTGRGLSRQSWHLVPKIRDVDALLHRRREARERLREAHPEVLLHALAGGRPMAYRKKLREGEEERLAVLERALGPSAPLPRQILSAALAAHPRRLLARDDVVDALAGAVAAWIGRMGFRTLPARPPRDGRGRPMEMVVPGTPDR
jgi:predicted RNase H-like nuclease